MDPHKEELKAVFDQLPSANLSGDKDQEIKLISFPLLEMLVSKMMDKAYYYGQVDGLNSLDTIMDKAFTH